MGLRLRVKFIYLNQEFYHTFTAGTSSLFRNYQELCEILQVDTPFDEELCKERLAAEILEHRLENCYTSWLFENLNFNSQRWINDIASHLHLLEFNWV